MNVLLLDQYSGIGGGQRVFLQIAKALTAAGYPLTIAFPRQGSLYSTLQAQINPRFDHIDLPQFHGGGGRKGLGYVLKLTMFTLNIIRKLRHAVSHTDIIYANGPQHFIAVALLSIMTGRPAVYHIHMVYGLSGWWLIDIISRLPTTRGLIACSGFVNDQARNATKQLARSEKLSFVENCLPEDFANLRFTPRFDQAKGRNVAVMGRICPAKGQNLVVGVASKLPDLHFHIIGPIFEEDHVWANQLKMRASRNVQFHNETGHVDQFVNDNDIGFVMVPSQCEEAFGLVLIEAAALSCIPIASTRGGLKGIAEHLNTPTFTTEEEAVEALRIWTQKSSEELLEEAKRIQKRTLDHYDHAKFTRSIQRLISNMLDFKTQPDSSRGQSR